MSVDCGISVVVSTVVETNFRCKCFIVVEKQVGTPSTSKLFIVGIVSIAAPSYSTSKFMVRGVPGRTDSRIAIIKCLLSNVLVIP